MSPHAERPGLEKADDPRWLFTILKAGFLVLGASNWMGDHFRRLPLVGQEQVSRPIGYGEAVPPRMLASYIQHALYLHNGLVAPQAGGDVWSLRARSAGSAMLGDSKQIALRTPRRENISFADTLHTASERHYVQARAEAHNASQWEHATDLGYGYAVESFTAVNLECLAQAETTPSKIH